jgi:hypothetical protein
MPNCFWSLHNAPVAVTHKRNVSEHMLMWTFFLVLAHGTRAQKPPTPISYTVCITSTFGLNHVELWRFSDVSTYIIVAILTIKISGQIMASLNETEPLFYVNYSTILSDTTINGRLAHESLILKDSEGSAPWLNRGTIPVSVGRDWIKTMKHCNHDIWCPGRDSNRISPEYDSIKLPSNQTVRRIWIKLLACVISYSQKYWFLSMIINTSKRTHITCKHIINATAVVHTSLAAGVCMEGDTAWLLQAQWMVARNRKYTGGTIEH